MKFKLGQNVILKDPFYNGIFGTILEYKEPLADISGTRFTYHPTQYLVEIAIENKRQGKSILHRIWIEEDDLK